MSRSALEREIVVQSKKNSSLPPNVPPPPVPPSLLFNTAPPISVIPGNHIVAAAIPTPKAVIIPAIPIPIPAPIPLMHQIIGVFRPR